LTAKNDPLSWSDDWNRALLTYKVIFMVPEFVVNTFVETLDTVRR